MKRWVVCITLVATVAPMAGCSGGVSQGAASEATGKALEIRNEKRAEIRSRILESHPPGRRGAGSARGQ